MPAQESLDLVVLCSSHPYDHFSLERERLREILAAKQGFSFEALIHRGPRQ